MSFLITLSASSIPELASKALEFGHAILLVSGERTEVAAEAPAPRRGLPPKAKKAETPAAAPATPAAAAAGATKDAVVKALVKLINANDALGKNGKQVCTDLCMKFGGKNVSAIPADKYGDVIAAVDEALEALSTDPTA